MEHIENINQQRYMMHLVNTIVYTSITQCRGHFTSKVMINRLTNKFEKQLGHKIDHWASYESFHRHFAFKHLIFIRRDD